MVLPAISIDYPNPSITKSWKWTKNNSFGLTVMVAALPIMMFFVQFLLANSPWQIEVLLEVFYFYIILVEVSILSLSFSYLSPANHSINKSTISS